jgi:hypothetical protein
MDVGIALVHAARSTGSYASVPGRKTRTRCAPARSARQAVSSVAQPPMITTSPRICIEGQNWHRCRNAAQI